ncbi:MAG: hypothetical protein KAI53_05555 [Candidatus Aenigmarchaeota archaeon]|nr:hypothetical protein [Candidatus Aenigmarchaeota archaeon]
MSLADDLVRIFGAPDIESARAVVKEGFVKVNSQIMTNPELPISTKDTIFVDENYAKKHAGYWQFRDMNKILGLFHTADDVIAASLSEGEIEFLEEKKITVRLIGENSPDNLLANTLIIGNTDNIFNTFTLIEKNKDLLLKKSTMLLRLKKEQDFEDTLNSIKKMAKIQGFSFTDAVKPEYARETYWAILKRD